ncbi:MAG: hypothetical protein ACO2PN_21180 [Pyrobaculum sp.]|jgi:hypothetical protein
MVCSVKVGSVVALEDAGCIYLSLVCGAKKIAEFCLSEEEYLSLGEPKPGDVVDFGVTATTYRDGVSMRRLEIRFLGCPVRI